MNMTVTASFETVSLTMAALKCTASTVYLLVAVVTSILLGLLSWPLTTAVALAGGFMLVILFVEDS
jgi:hypothetical protein